MTGRRMAYIGWGVVLVAAAGLLVSACDEETTTLAPSDATVKITAGATPTSPDPYEAGGGDDTIADATPLAIGTSQVRTVYPVGDNDYVSVNLTAGTTYEFSANNLCIQCDVYLQFYDTAMVEDTVNIGTNYDDYIYRDSRILYTATASGDHYIKVRGYDVTYVATYTLSARVFDDGVVFADEDGDSWSYLYDCDDTNVSIYPNAPETAGDGIDQNCSGTDYLLTTTPDGFEEDDTVSAARNLVIAGGSAYETIYRTPSYANNARTLTSDTESDWFRFTVPAYGKYTISKYYQVGGITFDIYEADGITPVTTFSGSYTSLNPTSVPVTYTLEMYVTTPATTAFTIPFVIDYGIDVDNDGYYTRDWATDCDDSDPAIHPLAAETAADGVDSNCNGADDT